MWKKVDIKPTKKNIKDWGKVLVLLLDEAAVLVLAVVALRFFEIMIPLPITIAIALVLGIVVFIVHVTVIPSFRRRIVTGSEGMIGSEGRVTEPLAPLGTVVVQGEHWKALSVDDHIQVGENVEIVGLNRLTLKVKRKA